MWDVITFLCPRYLLLAYKSSNNELASQSSIPWVSGMFCDLMTARGKYSLQFIFKELGMEIYRNDVTMYVILLKILSISWLA